MAVKLIIDGQEYEVADGITLMEACEEAAGKEIPRFCYHERLSIAGNCRMCLVEVVGAPKPIASCAQTVNELRKGPKGEPPEIRTDSDLVRKARRGVMEFLLINHPLDCPICDQGGECDLQDQAMAYGFDENRFEENKRAVENKYLGPLVKTIMTRCIHCTRCVRFMTEVAGVEELGAIGRGEDMEITTYLDSGLHSELQGNIIDLCPVGALTSRPYAFQARPWELAKTETIDVMDAVGSNIRVDSRGPRVMRILPRNNDAVNEEWISDKTRFVWDGLAHGRLDRPWVRREGVLQPASWEEALKVVADRLQSVATTRIGAIVGDLAAAEEMFALKGLMAGLRAPHIDCRQDGSRLDPKLGRETYLFNATIEGIERADAILLVGTNPRLEATVLNARIRKRWRMGALPIGLIGAPADLTYPYAHLGTGPATLRELAQGRHDFTETLAKAERPMVIVGEAALTRDDGGSILALAAKLAMQTGMVGAAEGWNGFCVLHGAASRVAGLDLGLTPGDGGLDVAGMIEAARTGELDVLYLLGADEIDTGTLGRATTFVIYQGTHGDRGAEIADVILPGAAYTEKSATWVNTEGRPQMSERAVFPPGEAKEDWAILRALSEAVGRTLPFDTLSELRALLYKEAPHLAALDVVEPAGTSGIETLARIGTDVSDTPLSAYAADYYKTNAIARASRVMDDLSRARLGGAAGAAGGEGIQRGEATGTDG